MRSMTSFEFKTFFFFLLDCTIKPSGAARIQASAFFTEDKLGAANIQASSSSQKTDYKHIIKALYIDVSISL